LLLLTGAGLRSKEENGTRRREVRMRGTRILLSTALWVVCMGVASGPLVAHQDITVQTAHEMILSGEELIVVDVREYYEFCSGTGHLENAASLPWNSHVLESRFGELPLNGTILVICNSGLRSHFASNFLDAQGFTAVYDVLGGTEAWEWELEWCDAECRLKIGKSDPWAAEIDWTPTEGDQDYDLLRGTLDDVVDAGTVIDLGITSCLLEGSAFTFYTETGSTPPGQVDFYLARRARESWGWSSSGQERVPTICE
jgi:rhodanese-related sulfurtransferase